MECIDNDCEFLDNGKNTRFLDVTAPACRAKLQEAIFTVLLKL